LLALAGNNHVKLVCACENRYSKKIPLTVRKQMEHAMNILRRMNLRSAVFGLAILWSSNCLSFTTTQIPGESESKVDNATAKILIARYTYQLKIKRPGGIIVMALWSGSANNLAIILNGPGQEGYFARKDGNTPLLLTYTVTPANLKFGTDWTISIVNFERTEAIGQVKIFYPESNTPYEGTFTISNVGVDPFTNSNVRTIDLTDPAQPDHSVARPGGANK
jgi:hypothetical protein